MIDSIFRYLGLVEYFLWDYVVFIFLSISGLYLTFYSKGFQFYALRNFTHNFKKSRHKSEETDIQGINPLKLYITSVGGMVGVGNIINVSTAICIGGLGSIFWMWITAFFGMLIKYSEIYLGIKYRVLNSKRHYDGGPMFFIPAAFDGIIGKFLASFSAVLLCIYSIEVYQFSTLVQTLQKTFAIDKTIIILFLLLIVLYVGIGGVNRLATMCSRFIPIFVFLYIFICLYIIVANIGSLPSVILDIFKSAFVGQAPIGGFVGSSMMLAGYYGVRTAVYSGDIGIGYESVIQSETNAHKRKVQAQMAIYALLTDSFLCTLTAFAVAASGAWCQNVLDSKEVMQNLMYDYLPHSNFLVISFLFLAIYTTITAYFTAGVKTSRFLSKKWGNYIFFTTAVILFSIFSYLPTERALTIMMISGGLLVLINVTAILKLRHQIDFNQDD
ncbi:hypothetical protein phytr_360 [Candidatus Phycorickettsia trachydisci]|uniref:Uncharacterized protein n=1 Tax=Candidatus Phycorickettsia trachydisci TaxID=2115978 RepID=A0A2P1P6V7_9RICK|nr:amino acid carrier protein [Candidatus Phycorickettsia trachydisci]AVP86999.1 hypothetical protein phytr_360 [Candidatus Phycorickettsia trachydisci]